MPAPYWSDNDNDDDDGSDDSDCSGSITMYSPASNELEASPPPSPLSGSTSASRSPTPAPSPIARLPPELIYKILALLCSPPHASLSACGDPFDPASPASKRFMMMPSLVEPDVGDTFRAWRAATAPLLQVCRLWKDVADPLVLQWVTLRTWQQLRPLVERVRAPLARHSAGHYVHRIDVALVPLTGDHSTWADLDAWSRSAVADFLALLAACPRLHHLLCHGFIPVRGPAREDPAEIDHAQLPFIPALPPTLQVLQLPAGLRISEKDLTVLASRCAALERLAFSGEWDVGWSAAADALAPGEQHLPRGRLEHLHAMDVIMEDPAAGPSVPALTEALAMPRLARLRVTTLLDEDASPSTRALFTRALTPLASSLRCLEIRGASHWTDRTLWDHTLLWSVLPLLTNLEDLVLDAFMDAPAEPARALPVPSVKRILLRGYFESLYWSVQVYAYEDCMARLAVSLRAILGPVFPGLKLLRLADMEPWSARTRKYAAGFRRWASQMEVTERFERFPTEEYEAVAREAQELCVKRGVRVEDRNGEQGDWTALAPVEWCWPQYITDLYRVAGAIV
ncbi:hypothetical protein CALCODRAFT_508214 [Calocera cornea HHB12733]|uniref:F-box domain-containing protein n=1 Tax=Calocera cornea HHB12733 TaxID=1353952 RepID=A0A165GQ80_9BASI|nr:hypothetical protein CALCODRAFT_508214 [Calocera cornea HHB12733]